MAVRTIVGSTARKISSSSIILQGSYEFESDSTITSTSSNNSRKSSFQAIKKVSGSKQIVEILSDSVGIFGSLPQKNEAEANHPFLPTNSTKFDKIGSDDNFKNLTSGKWRERGAQFYLKKKRQSLRLKAKSLAISATAIILNNNNNNNTTSTTIKTQQASLSLPFLESNWNRVGGISKFRSYGNGANDNEKDVCYIFKTT